MRIVFPYNSWRGGFLASIMKACAKIGHETIMLQEFKSNILNKIERRSFIPAQKNRAIFNKACNYNKDLINQLQDLHFDIFFNLSGSGIFPDTIKNIRDISNCLTICLISDNPFDAAPFRDKYFPMTLRDYDIILLPEPIWEKQIKNVAPHSKIIKFFGGYDPENFFYVENETKSLSEIEKFRCDLSFTGSSYGKSPEGAYRSGVLGQLNNFDVKIWGDKGWKYRFRFYPFLEKAYQGERLDYNSLRKLYNISKINLNMPSPQIITSFQPRVFEISASKGFQIIDYSDELFNIFKNDEIVTFKGFDDLKEKIEFYLKNEKERLRIVEAAYKRVVDEFTWEKQINKILNII